MACAYILGIIIVAEVLILGYGVVTAPPEDANNSYQRVIVTDIQKGQTGNDTVIAEIRAEPYLYCPRTESLAFRIGAEFYNDSEILGSGTPDPDEYKPFGLSDVEIPRGGRNITIRASNESLSPDRVDAIRVYARNRRDQQYPPCNEIAFPEELPPDEYWLNLTATTESLSREDDTTEA